MFAGVIDRDVFHRAGTIKRHQRDDVLDAVWPHADQRLAHAGTFHLEHADGFAARQHLVSFGVIQRDGGKINLDAALGNKIDGYLQHRQRLQAEEVEFDEAGAFHPFHVELGDRHIGSRIAIHRHQLGERPIANDDTGGVGGGVTVKPLNLLCDIQEAGDDRLLVRLFLQARLFLDRF
ncbi:hypothetical protein D3C78_1248650 [compost metagenome]